MMDILTDVRWYLIVVLTDVEYLFMYLLAILYTFFGVMLRSCAHFSIGLFFCYWVVWIFCIQLPLCIHRGLLPRQCPLPSAMDTKVCGCSLMHRWFSGRILTCRTGGLGLIPSPCSFSVPFGSSDGSDGNESAFSVGDPVSIPGLGKSPREGNGNPLQYSCLENSMGRGACWATVCGITESHNWEASPSHKWHSICI